MSDAAVHTALWLRHQRQARLATVRHRLAERLSNAFVYLKERQTCREDTAVVLVGN